MKKGDLTLVVARSSHYPPRKYSISRLVLLTVAAVSVGSLVAFTLSSLHYFQMWSMTADYSVLKDEVDRLRSENEEYQLSARQLEEKISSLEVNFKKLRILAGFDRDGFGGQGGPLSPGSGSLLPTGRDLLRHFNSLDRRRITLETELRQLQEYYTTRSLLLSATPAIMPLRGYPSDNFGYRTDPFTGEREFHPGIDISVPRGQKVIATADGIVSFSGRRFGYGNLVALEHRFGISTRYGHLDRIAVKLGQRVKKGDIVGYAGSTGRATGVHLHYEVRLNDIPLNPLRFFRDSE